MEWKSLSILAVICHLTASVYGGPTEGKQSSATDGKKSHRASIVMCHSEQTFFCINFTHYSPCVHVDLADLANTSFVLSHGGEFYCGTERCCQVGADSPCTYRCQPQALEFKNPRISWNFAHMKKKKKKRNKEPLTSEEVDRLNRIVSVKSFIIRQKDLEEWDDDYDEFDDNIYKWKPSYRTFCPLRELLVKDVDIACATNKSRSGVNETSTTTSTTTTELVTTGVNVTSTTTSTTTTEPITTGVKVTSTTTSTTMAEPITLETYSTIKGTISITTALTTTSSTTARTTTTPTTKRTTTTRTTTIPTTRRTTTTRATTRHTTTTLATTRLTTTRSTTTRRTTTRSTTTRRTTTRPRPTKSKHTTKTTRRTRKPRPTRTTHRTKPPKLHTKAPNHNKPSLNCTSSIIHRKHNIVGTCQDYYECIKTPKGQYAWIKRSCPQHEYFDVKYQLCRMIENVECRVVPSGNKEKRWHNVVQEQHRDIYNLRD